MLEDDLYFPSYDTQVKRLMSRSQVTTLVACDKEEPDIIYGWLCYESKAHNPLPALHYVFVKELARSGGVATALFTAAGVSLDSPFFYTFRTPASNAILQRHPAWRDNATYKPVLVRKPEP
jgi:hypothetical protein